ncbi:MAG: nucleotide exchange factor GrpE [Ignavibacteria bacterium]|jgi:molecular chaperone GrpE|nr:nucleotide exchange factor GrpE [Ignavibacteria bacterium]
MKKSDKHKDHAEEQQKGEKVKVDIKDSAAKEEKPVEPKADTKEAETEKLKLEVQKYKDSLLRKMAEFENYKKRTDSEISNYLKYASEHLLKSLLPVYDDLNRSIESIEKGETKDFETLKQGIQSVTDKFKNILASEGLSEVEVLGKEFDVNTSEAILQIPNADVPPHTVVEVVEKGYKLKDKVIRFAKVIVSDEPENKES